MPFLNFNSITNHYNNKDIEYFVKENPDFNSCQFAAQQKYDGSNFQLIFDKNEQNELEKVQFGSRNCALEENENFNGHRKLVTKEPYKRMIENITKFFTESPELTSINVYGEIYGNVIKRIDYYAKNEDRSENKLVFYDVKFNGETKSTEFFTDWAKKMEMPVVETYVIGTLEECLAVDVDQFKTVSGDKIEGIVIKPWKHENETIRGFYLKKKAAGFDEITVKKTVKVAQPVKEKPKLGHVKCTEEQKADLIELEAFLNVNRLMSAFSKRPWLKTETTNLACEMLEDALKEFRIDHENTKVDLELAKKAFLPDIFKLIKQQDIFQHT